MESKRALSTNAKKPRQVDFSAVTLEDLKNLGIVRKRLAFNPTVAKNLVNQFKPDDAPIMADLYSRVKKIYERVNTNRGAGSRMIIEAVLLAAAEVSSDKNSKRNVVIVPEMSISPITVTNPLTGYELCLSGSVNYVVVEHEDADDMNNRGELKYQCLLDLNVSREDVADISQNCFFVTVAKCLDRSLASYIPEAVSQSIAWLNSVEEFEHAYFCVTNGKEWMFCILVLDSDVYLESTIHRLTTEELQHSDKPLREIVQLIRQWVREEPDLKDLYKFDY